MKRRPSCPLVTTAWWAPSSSRPTRARGPARPPTNVGFVCLITFGIGLALAGAAGALVSFVFSFFPAKQWDWIAILLALVVLGGMGKLHGMIVAALVLTVIAAFVGAYFSATWSGITFYLALFLILLIRPQVLFGDKVEES
jgi:branched-chain amino acid transport system permease protein